MNQIINEEWKIAINRAAFCVAITGAGISKASGLPLLCDQVEGVPLAEVFRSELLKNRPDHFYDTYRSMLSEWRVAVPNAAHIALAQRGIWVVTQNVDGLHRDANTRHLIELHGNLRELHCPTCAQIYGSELCWRASVPVCPGCGDVLWPGIALEGGEVRHFSRALDWVGRANVLLVVGTSLTMHPVRKLPEVAKDNGAVVIDIHHGAEVILPELLSYQSTSETRDRT